MLYTLDEQQCRNLEVSAKREWLLVNGIGGYAMGTVSGINTRRYHGHLIAATTPPTGRMLLLAGIDAFVHSGGNPVGISANQYPGAIHPEGYHYIRSFSVGKVATWRYRAGGNDIEKRLAIHPNENAITVTYKNLSPNAVTISLRPLVTHRDHHGNSTERSDYPHSLNFQKDTTVVEDHDVSLVLSHPGGYRTPVQGWYYRAEHQREIERGLEPRDDLFCPCEIRYDLQPNEEVHLTASSGKAVEPISTDEDQSGNFRLTTALQKSAEKFFIDTKNRHSVIAGFPWFTDWGRDTMIAIPGLCIHTGRIAEAKAILLDYASALNGGLIPNRFVEQGETPDYNTVDATLWFANAAYKVLASEWDAKFAKKILSTIVEIDKQHVAGTYFGIKVDPADGLLTQGQDGVQLTWMDAKVGDWVVTPRHGKPVEINGLWVNLLNVMAWLQEKLGDKKAAATKERAEFAAKSFEAKFWHPVRKHYLDTVEPADASLRPNQVLAMALPFSPCKPEHATKALEVVTQHLLTPVGLRTLGPEEPGYCGRFEGDMPRRDAAYHQGTVWPWLLGSYVTALVRYTGDKKEGRRILRATKRMFEECGLGGISEVYDGDEPQSPGGCPWQAWSVAEILRSWEEDIGGD